MVDYILGTGSFKFLKFWKVLCPGQKLYNWAGNIYGHWSLFYMIVLGWKKWEWRQKKEIQLLHYLFRTGQGQHDLYFRTFLLFRSSCSLAHCCTPSCNLHTSTELVTDGGTVHNWTWLFFWSSVSVSILFSGIKFFQLECWSSRVCSLIDTFFIDTNVSSFVEFQRWWVL